MFTPIDYEQVADLYDVYVQTSRDIPFFVNEARQVEGEVLELMCGTGRVSIPLLEAGTVLSCVDYSPAMLALLREKLAARGLAADVREMDVRRLALGKQFAQIIIPFHAFAELTKVEDQRQTLRQIKEHLAPTGTFICTLHNPPVRRQRIDGQWRLWGEFDLRDGGKLFLWGREEREYQSQLVSGNQRYKVYDSSGTLKDERSVTTRFRLLARDEFAALAQESGFHTVAIYGDYGYQPYVEESSPFMLWKLTH